MITKFKIYESLDIDIDISIIYDEVKIFFYFSYKSILYWLDVHAIKEEYYDEELFTQKRKKIKNKVVTTKALDYLEKNYSFKTKQLFDPKDKSEIREVSFSQTLYLTLKLEYLDVKFKCYASIDGDNYNITDIDFKSQKDKEKWEILEDQSRFGLIDLPDEDELDKLVIDYLEESF